MRNLGTVTLETDRLILRKCKLDDYRDSYKYCCSDPELARLQAFDVHENDGVTKRSFKEKEDQYLIDPTFYEWAIVRKEDNQFMGEIALVDYDEKDNSIQLGYHLGKLFRKNGYMKEAIDRIISFAFEELEVDEVYALILNDNLSSKKVVMSNDLVYSNTIEDYKDEVYEGPIDKYSMTKKVYFDLHGKKSVVDFAMSEIIRRSNKFQSETNGTKDEYNLWVEHVQYVYKYALLIAQNKDKDIDLEVIKLSALLHDISMTDRSLDGSRHNEYSAEIAERLLSEFGYPTNKIELIKKCILNHSSKRKKFRSTIEEQVMVDADAMAHFDCVDSLYSLANMVMNLDEKESLEFVKNKLTRDYNEISDSAKKYIEDKYWNIMNSNSYYEVKKIRR